MAIDAKGTIYYSFLGLVGRGNLPMGVFLTTSSDRGRTFSPPKEILGPLNFAVRMAIDPTMGDRGRIHLAWLHAGTEPGLGSLGTSDNPILTAYSDDGGDTLSEPIQINDDDRRRVVAPSLVLGPDHSVYVGYYDLGDDVRDYQGLDGPVWEGTWELLLARSFNAGEEFGPSVVVEPEVAPHERVMVIFTMPPAALAVRGEQACVAWTDARNGDADVLMRCSGDRGDTWGAPKRLNDDPVASGAWQYMPRLGISPDGRLDAVFYDRRDDQQNVHNDVRYIYSRDGGTTFSPQMKLTSAGMSLTLIGQQYAVPSAGDRYDFGFRIALLSTDEEMFSAWADTHNSLPPTKTQDVFGVVVKPPPPQKGLVPAVAGLILVLLGIVGLVLGRRQRGGSTSADDAPAPSDAVA